MNEAKKAEGSKELDKQALEFQSLNPDGKYS